LDICVTFKHILVITFIWAISLQAKAADNLYTVFSLGYSDVEFNSQDSDGLGYKLTIGYQVAPQWYLEMGYQQLVHDELYVTDLPSAQDVVNAESVKQGDALFLAFLGKASGRMGELFYRIGVLKTDIKGQDILAAMQECEVGQASMITVEDFGAATMCDYDESGIAGVIGLGFDYFVGARTMIRTEIEYIKGQDNLTVAAAYIGLRYNF
jgi:hypothetical protein